MRKIIANGTVLGWSLFWVFGFLALTAPPGATVQTAGATIIAFAGLAVGVWCYLKLVRGPL